jgi:hypothetical protein
MSRMMQIEFEKCGVFAAELFEADAPKTCGAIWKRLPLEFEFFQSIISGQAIFALPNDLTVDPENQMVLGIPPGTISFLVRDPPRLVPDEIYIAYGTFISRGLTLNNYHPVNVFAKVTENLNELKTVGQRIWKKGAEKVIFRKKE